MVVTILDLPYVGKCSDSTLHFPFEGYILSHYETLEEEKLWEWGNYSKNFPHFHFLGFASLYPCWLNHSCSSHNLSIVFVGFHLHGALKWWSPRWRNLVSWFQRFSNKCCHIVSMFYINRNIHFSSKFHVQVFIFVSMGIFYLYMFKWIMLVWMVTFNIFHMLGYTFSIEWKV